MAKISGTMTSAGCIVGAMTSGITRNMNEPMTRLTPGFIIRLTSRTSLVARAITSPTDC